MTNLVNSILGFSTIMFARLRPTVGSINGALIPSELLRAAKVGLGASTVVAGIVAALTFLAGDTGRIFTSPTIAGLVTFVLTQAAVQVGQLGHGAVVETVSLPCPGHWRHDGTEAFQVVCAKGSLPDEAQGPAMDERVEARLKRVAKKVADLRAKDHRTRYSLERLAETLEDIAKGLGESDREEPRQNLRAIRHVLSRG